MHGQVEEFLPSAGGPVGDVGAVVATGGTAAGGGVTGIAAGDGSGGAGSAAFGGEGVCGAVCGITSGATGGAGADGNADRGATASDWRNREERCGRMVRSAEVGRCSRGARPGRAGRSGRPRCVLGAAGLTAPRLAASCAVHAGDTVINHSVKARAVSCVAAALIVAGAAAVTPADTHARM